MQMKAMIVGHSVCARLQSDLTAGSDPRMEYSVIQIGWESG